MSYFVGLLLYCIYRIVFFPYWTPNPTIHRIQCGDELMGSDSIA